MEIRVPPRDSIHDIVRQALIQDGWEITDDPYVIAYGERFLFVDLGASTDEENLIGAQRRNRRIAIEIKKFRSRSTIADLEQAIGQYVLYELLLQQVDPDREIYLAITDVVFDEVFQEPIGKLVLDNLPLRLLVVSLENAEVLEWIPETSIERL
jgi:hypothetical protein